MWNESVNFLVVIIQLPWFQDFNIEIPIKDIINFYKNPTKSSENFKAPGGYVSISKKEANNIIDSYYENWPDEINFDLN